MCLRVRKEENHESNACSIQMKVLTQTYYQVSTSSSSRRTVLGFRLHAGCSRSLFRSFFTFLFKLELGRLFALRSIPVVHHLGSNYSIERKGCDEAVENELVRNFLQGSEDSRKRACKVVEDLDVTSISGRVSCSSM